MSSYSEWLGRHLQNQQKFLDTRPRRDAGHQTEVVKRQATVRIDRRPTGLRVMPASGFTDYIGGVQYRTGQGAQNKTAQLAQVCASVAEPPLRNEILYPEVLKGLGRSKLANCCVTCGPTSDATNCPCTRRTYMS